MHRTVAVALTTVLGFAALQIVNHIQHYSSPIFQVCSQLLLLLLSL